MAVECFFRILSIPQFQCLWSEMRSLNIGKQGLVLNSTFRRMISPMTFYRNKISVSVYHNFSSAYTALYDTICGHFLTNILLRRCMVIKVTLPTFHFS
jgi:hypothetical protein